MSNSLTPVTRDVVTPVTTVLFVVSIVTGLMLFLHWNAGLVRTSHEWLSLGFGAIALWHLARNWRGFLRYLKRSPGLIALSTALLVSLAFTGMTASDANVSPRAVFGALSGATLERTAPAFGLTTESAIARLEALGVEAGPGETLDAIGRRAGRVGPEIATLLAQGAQGAQRAAAPAPAD